MALIIADRVFETTTTTGTGTYTLAGAKTGFQSFAAVGNGNTTYYACTDGVDYEVGLGTYTASGTTLARTTIIGSSNSDAAVNWGAGEKSIFVTLPASKALVQDANDAVTQDGDLTVTGNLTVQGTTITVDSATAQNIVLGDNDKMTFGAGSDLQIYHDGSHSYIKDAGTGNLLIQGANIRLESDTGENFLAAFPNAEVRLYYDSVEKLSTTSTGIDVTGTVTADGLTVDGNVSLNGGTSATIITSDANRSGAGFQISGLLGKWNGTNAANIGIYTGSDTTNKDDGVVKIQTSEFLGTLRDRVLFANNGDISFYEDTGTTAKFFWDASAESLSLGGTLTTALQTPLRVKSNSSDYGICIEENSGGETWQIGVDVDGDLGFYNSGSTTASVTFDDSGNLLVGTTSAYGTDGATISSSGFIFSKRTSNVGLGIDRLTTDGDLIEFKKDGVPVGSIGVTSLRMFLGTGDTGLFFNDQLDSIDPWDTSSNAARDGAIDLGDSTRRFKDLYLSNAVVQDGVKATTTATTQVTLETFAHANHDGAKVVITAATSADTYVTELLIATNGTTAVATEYGQIGTGSALATYDVDISGANVRILATPASTTSTTFRVAMTLT